MYPSIIYYCIREELYSHPYGTSYELLNAQNCNSPPKKILEQPHLQIRGEGISPVQASIKKREEGIYPVQASIKARDAETAKKLWMLSEKVLILCALPPWS